MRIFRNTWVEKEVNEEKVKEIVRQRRISFATAKYLESKELTAREMNQYLSGDFSGERIYQSDRAADLLMKHSTSKVVIFGDYDVDGMTSATLLGDFLEKNGFTVERIIPNRYDHGYGLNEKSLDLIPKDTSLLITVDCGISSVEEIEKLKKQGIEVIVTDHHEAKEELPSCIVINPKLKNPSLSQLAGVGVVYFWIQYLIEERSFLKIEDMEALTALGTVADIMPLTGDNRVIVKRGLEQLESTKRKGLRSLLNALGIQGRLSAWDMGFRIAPLLNAAGRMGRESLSMKALSTEGIGEEDVSTLLRLNEERKKSEERVIQDVDKKRELASCIVSASENWLQGVLGLAASKVAEKYRLPAYLFTIEDGIYKGSCRSVGDFDILKSLERVKEYLLTYGGHRQAAGLQVTEENYPFVKEQLENYTAEHLLEEDRRKSFSFISQQPEELSLEVAKELETLSPYGMGNPAPVYGLKNCTLLDFRVYRETFYRLHFRKEEKEWVATFFSKGKEDFRKGEKYDIIYTPEVNNFRGQSSLQLRLKDYRNTSFLSPVLNPFVVWRTLELAKSFAHYNVENKGIFFVSPQGYFQHHPKKFQEYEFPTKLPNVFLWKEMMVDKTLLEKEIISAIVDRQELMKGYHYLKSRKDISYDQVQSLLKTFLTFEIFSELGLLEPVYLEDRVCYEMAEIDEKVSLDASKIYRNGLKIKEEWSEFKGQNSSH